MGQRARILTEILGFDGWRVKEAFFESADGKRVVPVRGYAMVRETKVVLVVERRWVRRCSRRTEKCLRVHEQGKARRWADLPWGGHSVELEYAPSRVKCRSCGSANAEMVAWADPYQRQTHRLQQRLAVEAASMPVMHVAALHGLSWLTVRRAEEQALARWELTRPARPLRHVGVDEKWLGRRHQLAHKFVTIVSDLETGEPLWIGRGRSEAKLRSWLESLSMEQRATIKLFAMDLHRAFWNAVDGVPGLEHAPVVHDPFHIMKLAGNMLDDLRREVFFRASAEMRAVGKGRRWLLLRAWEHTNQDQRADLKALLAHNKTLARAYQIKEELREVLHAPNRTAMKQGLDRILRRTSLRSIRPLRRLHDTLNERYNEIVSRRRPRAPLRQPDAQRRDRRHDRWRVRLSAPGAPPRREPRSPQRVRRRAKPRREGDPRPRDGRQVASRPQARRRREPDSGRRRDRHGDLRVPPRLRRGSRARHHHERPRAEPRRGEHGHPVGIRQNRPRAPVLKAENVDPSTLSDGKKCALAAGKGLEFLSGEYVNAAKTQVKLTIDPRSSAVRALGCPETLWANGAVYVYAPHFAFSAR